MILSGVAGEAGGTAVTAAAPATPAWMYQKATPGWPIGTSMPPARPPSAGGRPPAGGWLRDQGPGGRWPIPLPAPAGLAEAGLR